MNNLPSNISRKNFTHHWAYLDSDRKPLAIVARYDEPGKKKRFHQYRIGEDENWVEGAPTPSPIFGIDSLPNGHYEGFVYIFEGEKCTQAAHYLGLPAITSMMGSSQGHLADWAILASYRHIKKFILVPDNDAPGQKYMQLVYEEVKKACPNADVMVCELPANKKGDDFIDWLKAQSSCPSDWDEFSPLDDPYCNFLKVAFEKFISDSSIKADDYFLNISSGPIAFESEPEPIDETLSEVLPCPIHTLPTYIISWIQNFADQMQLPVDFFVAPLLVYVGSIIGRKRALKVRPDTKWIEYANLWGMLIGRPAVMKSPAMESMIDPLGNLAEKGRKAHAVALETFDKQYRAWEIRKKAAEEVYKKAYKDKLGSNQEDSGASLNCYSEDPPKKPARKRYKTDDTTVEKLGELLIENRQGLLLYRDELSGWLNSFVKQGRENDRQFFLESWSGKKDFDVDRIGRGSLHVPSLFLSIFGSIQPGPLSQYVRSTIKGGIGDDGFLQRFQIMVWPNVKPDWELVEGMIDKEIEADVTRLFEYLDHLNFDSESKPIQLSFSVESQILFNEWQKELENRLRSGVLPPHLEAHFAKYKKLVPALCIILEHLKAFSSMDYPMIISVDTFKDVLNWIAYFESHAHRVYGCAANAVPKAACTLLNHIRAGDIVEPFSTRDVYYGHHWSGLSAVEEVEEVLDYLVEKGHLSSSTIKTNGRPSKKYWVHPKVFEG